MEKRNLTKAEEERLERHIKTQTAAITLEAHRQEVLSLKRLCFSSSVFFDMTFENDQTPDAKGHREAKQYAENFEKLSEQGIGMVFYGPCGTGKTYLAAAIANALCESRKEDKSRYDCYMTNLQREIYTAGDNVLAQVRMRRLLTADLLILDDFGTEYKTEFAISRTFEVINGRYERRKPTIITTNLTKKQLGDPGKDYESIFSRIFENSLFYAIEGDDKRKVRAKNLNREISKIIKGPSE